MTMTYVRIAIAAALIPAAVLVQHFCGEEANPAEARPLGGTVSAPASSADFVTLFSRDELLCAYSIRSHDVGMVLADGKLANRATDVMFDRYGRDVLAIAVEGGAMGAIVDLGEAPIKDTDQTAFWYLKREGEKVTCTATLTTEREPTDFSNVVLRSNATVPAILGHTYVMKCTYSDPKTPVLYAAIKVIDMTPRQSATIRWRILD